MDQLNAVFLCLWEQGMVDGGTLLLIHFTPRGTPPPVHMSVASIVRDVICGVVHFFFFSLVMSHASFPNGSSLRQGEYSPQTSLV
jgi:hypothetical protein